MWTQIRLLIQESELDLLFLSKRLLKLISDFCYDWLFHSLPHRDAFNTFVNRTDPDQAALVRAA